jgi:hypothetical protein
MFTGESPDVTFAGQEYQIPRLSSNLERKLMRVIYYATASRSAVETAIGGPGYDLGNEFHETWHVVSLDGRSFHMASRRPTDVADYEEIKEYLTPKGTLLMGLARRFVEAVSDGIEEIEISKG